MKEDLPVKYETDHGEVKLSPGIIRKYLVNGKGNVTDSEIVMFINLCRYQKLNPFLRDAYIIKYGDDSPATIVTGKDTFTKRAQRNEDYQGMKAGIIVRSNDKLEYREGAMVIKGEELIGGWSEVYRKGYVAPIRTEVGISEYEGRKKNGEIQANWKKMPATMIRKVALVQALREAFPADFQGLYSPEEMSVDEKLPDEAVELPEEPERIVTPEKDVTPDPVPTTLPNGKKLDPTRQEIIDAIGAALKLTEGLVNGEGKPVMAPERIDEIRARVKSTKTNTALDTIRKSVEKEVADALKTKVEPVINKKDGVVFGRVEDAPDEEPETEEPEILF